MTTTIKLRNPPDFYEKLARDAEQLGMYSVAKAKTVISQPT
jgi:hypothetical protein